METDVRADIGGSLGWWDLQLRDGQPHLHFTVHQLLAFPPQLMQKEDLVPTFNFKSSISPEKIYLSIDRSIYLCEWMT
jgi:hypothetical protein